MRYLEIGLEKGSVIVEVEVCGNWFRIADKHLAVTVA